MCNYVFLTFRLPYSPFKVKMLDLKKSLFCFFIALLLCNKNLRTFYAFLYLAFSTNVAKNNIRAENTIKTIVGVCAEFYI